MRLLTAKLLITKHLASNQLHTRFVTCLRIKHMDTIRMNRLDTKLLFTVPLSTMSKLKSKTDFQIPFNQIEFVDKDKTKRHKNCLFF